MNRLPNRGGPFSWIRITPKLITTPDTPYQAREIRLKPDFPEAHYNLGIELDLAGKMDDAISEFREAVRLRPDFAKAHERLGVALFIKGDEKGALEEYRKAFTLDPRNNDARSNYERLSRRMSD
jgi:Flp pilus assembly protein TadD